MTNPYMWGGIDRGDGWGWTRGSDRIEYAAGASAAPPEDVAADPGTDRRLMAIVDLDRRQAPTARDAVQGPTRRGCRTLVKLKVVLAPLCALLACSDGTSSSMPPVDRPDQSTADAGPDEGPDEGLDASTRPDAYRGEGPYGDGNYVNAPPDHSCTTYALDLNRDLPGDFVSIPFGQGLAVGAGDFDQNGVDELLVEDDVIPDDQIPDAPYTLRKIISAYELVDGVWQKKYQTLHFVPFSFIDLDGDGTPEVLGRDAWAVTSMSGSGISYGYGAETSIRAERIDDEWAWETRAVLFCVERLNGQCDPWYPSGSSAVAAGDFDLDGKPDVAAGVGNQIIEWNGTSFDVIFDGLDDPVITDPRRGMYPGNNTQLTHGDYDGDGLPEVVFGTYGPWRYWDPAVPEDGQYPDEHGRVVEGKGDNTFVDIARLVVGAAPISFASTGDVTGDGKDDLLMGAGVCRSYQLFSSVGDDAFRQIWLGEVNQNRAAVGANASLADIDGDGDAEMVAFMDGVLTVWDWVPDAASVHGGTMLQIYGEEVCADVCNTVAVTTGDFDGDGRAEIVTYDSRARVREGVDESWQAQTAIIIRELR